MYPTILIEMINTAHREQIANHTKLVHLRRLEFHDRVLTDDEPQSRAVPAFGALVARMSSWLGRMRPARVG